MSFVYGYWLQKKQKKTWAFVARNTLILQYYMHIVHNKTDIVHENQRYKYEKYPPF